MKWVKPDYNTEEVNAAGEKLSRLFQFPTQESQTITKEGLNAIHVANNWRISYDFPTHQWYQHLKFSANAMDPDVIVAKRIKRLPTILDKLKRKPHFTLATMHDIGGGVGPLYGTLLYKTSVKYL